MDKYFHFFLILLFITAPSLCFGEEQKITSVDGIDHTWEAVWAPVGFRDFYLITKNINLQIDKFDRANMFPDPKFGIGGMINITRATPIKVNDAGQEHIYKTWTTTVGEFLTENDLSLGEKDKISANDDEKLSTNKEIIITRVSSTIVKEYDSVDYKTITKKDPDLERGITKTAQTGKLGKKELRYAVVKENGKEVSKKLAGSEIILEPQDKIILEGTKVVVLGKGSATWYSLISGLKAASNTLPMGSQVLVRAINSGKEVVVTIADRGIQGDAIIDLSADAFAKIAPLGAGKVSVVLEKP